MPRVLISAGHTLLDPGAVYQDLREADLSRKIAAKVSAALQPSGLQIINVPLDLPIFERIEWINRSGLNAAAGDILVEMHINDSDTTKRGFEIWYEGKGNNASQNLGVTIMDAVVSELNFASQGVRSEYQHELGSLRFLNQTQPSAVLVEALYLDNREDIQILKNDAELDKVAAAIAKGIAAYCGKSLQGEDLAADKKPNFANLIDKYSPKEADRAPTLPAIPPRMPLPTVPIDPNPFANPGATSPSNMFMDRERRKEMIEKTYEKIIGQKPNQTDLNNYLNRGISEDELIKKLVDSAEHADMIKASEELANVKKDQDDLQKKISRLQATVRDMGSLLEQLNKLVQQKNKAIGELEETVQERHGIPSQVHRAIQAQKSPQSSTTTHSGVKFSHKLTEKFFRGVSKRI